MKRLAMLVSVGAMALFVGVGPALADTAIRHTGKVGPHRLIDSMQKPGMTCVLAQSESPTNENPGGGWWTLKNISVRPPLMRGTRDYQRVAWRFIVERGFIGTGIPVDPEWKVTYRSPRQFGIAHVHVPADFTRMSVGVKVPGPHPGGDGYEYRVKVKMFWYRPNGSVQGKAVHAPDYHREIPPDDAFIHGSCITSRPPA